MCILSIVNYASDCQVLLNCASSIKEIAYHVSTNINSYVKDNTKVKELILR